MSIPNFFGTSPDAVATLHLGESQRDTREASHWHRACKALSVDASRAYVVLLVKVAACVLIPLHHLAVSDPYFTVT